MFGGNARVTSSKSSPLALYPQTFSRNELSNLAVTYSPTSMGNISGYILSPGLRASPSHIEKK